MIAVLNKLTILLRFANITSIALLLWYISKVKMCYYDQLLSIKNIKIESFTVQFYLLILIKTKATFFVKIESSKLNIFKIVLTYVIKSE